MAFSAATRDQTDDVKQLSIVVEASTVSSPGGERVRVGGRASADESDKTVRHGFSLRADDCTWGVSGVVEPAAALGWAVETTPIRVVDDAATFRLVWARTRDQGKASTQTKNGLELTLRPGESIPLDSVLLPCSKRPAVVGQSLRVKVVRHPDPDYDRRLIAVNLWLVEKFQDGTERSEPLSLRGLYHHPMPFYFDSIAEKGLALDIFGEVTAAPGDRTSDVRIITRSRVSDPSQPQGTLSPRETTATMKIAPNEVVAIQLPQVANASVFASRALSLRIQVRVMRQ